MPTTPFSWTPRENLLTFEELFLFVNENDYQRKMFYVNRDSRSGEDLHELKQGDDG